MRSGIAGLPIGAGGQVPSNGPAATDDEGYRGVKLASYAEMDANSTCESSSPLVCWRCASVRMDARAGVRARSSSVEAVKESVRAQPDEVQTTAVSKTSFYLLKSLVVSRGATAASSAGMPPTQS